MLHKSHPQTRQFSEVSYGALLQAVTVRVSLGLMKQFCFKLKVSKLAEFFSSWVSFPLGIEGYPEHILVMI